MFRVLSPLMGLNTPLMDDSAEVLGLLGIAPLELSLLGVEEVLSDDGVLELPSDLLPPLTTPTGTLD